jgi:hypothetical protein
VKKFCFISGNRRSKTFVSPQICFLKKVTATITGLFFCMQIIYAQTGYIYVHAKTISEDINRSFTYSVSGGSTSVPSFTLEDQLVNIEPTDIGAGNGTGGGELWVVAAATQGADGSIYHRSANSSTWNLVSGGGAGSAIDGADLGHFVIVNSTGDAYVYNGSSYFKIFNHSTYGIKAVDIANNGSINPGTGFTAIVGANGHVWKYTGNYITTTTWSDITPTDNSGLTFTRLDINPSNNNIILVDGGGYVTKVNSSGGSMVYYNRTASGPSTPGDVTVDDNGTMYSIQNDAQGMDAAYRYNGTTWVEEPETGLHYFLTSSDAGQVWIIKGYTAAQSSSFANPSTIYTRTGDGSGTWLDDERVQTTQNDDAIIIPVAAGTYTITEANPAGWNLQKIAVFDPTSGSTINVAANNTSVVVGAGKVVHVLFTNGIVAPLAIPSNCGTSNALQNFGSGALNTRGNPLTGLTDFHYYSNSSLNTTPDGYYSLTQNSSQWGNGTLTDHTGLTGGYFLMINASYAPNEFYRQRVTGLAKGASYTLTFWGANLSPGSPLQPNILAGITDTSSGATLGSISTGSLPTDNAWHQYTFSFTATVTTGDIFLQNNAPGGFGNDLAIDDISITQVCSSLLPVTLINFNAVKNGNGALLSWSMLSNPESDYVDIERSVDNGINWNSLGTVMTSGALAKNYSFRDAHPENGTNLYRLKIKDQSGSFIYSNTKRIDMQAENSMTLGLYPNPAPADNLLNVQLRGLKEGTYKVRLVSSAGASVKEIAYNISNTSSTLFAISTEGVLPGIYLLTVNGNNQQFSKSVVIINK